MKTTVEQRAEMKASGEKLFPLDADLAYRAELAPLLCADIDELIAERETLVTKNSILIAERDALKVQCDKYLGALECSNASAKRRGVERDALRKALAIAVCDINSVMEDIEAALPAATEGNNG